MHFFAASKSIRFVVSTMLVSSSFASIKVQVAAQDDATSTSQIGNTNVNQIQLPISTAIMIPQQQQTIQPVGTVTPVPSSRLPLTNGQQQQQIELPNTNMNSPLSLNAQTPTLTQQAPTPLATVQPLMNQNGGDINVQQSTTIRPSTNDRSSASTNHGFQVNQFGAPSTGKNAFVSSPAPAPVAVVTPIVSPIVSPIVNPVASSLPLPLGAAVAPSTPAPIVASPFVGKPMPSALPFKVAAPLSGPSPSPLGPSPIVAQPLPIQPSPLAVVEPVGPLPPVTAALPLNVSPPFAKAFSPLLGGKLVKPISLGNKL